MDTVIRTATGADVPAICAIYNEVVENSDYSFVTEPNSLQDQRRWLAERLPHYPVLVVEWGGLVAGWASLSAWANHHGYNRTVEVSFFVDREHRGKGLGGVLLPAIVEAGIERGFRVFISRIVAGNEPSIRLHERFGFERVGVQKQVGHKNGRWHDVVLYQKNCHAGACAEE